jgi:hypothetical protein
MRTGFTDFSGAAPAQGAAELSIELTAFNAIANNNVVNLFWTTLNETNNDYFTVERSKNAINFETVTNVSGGGTINKETHYTSTDEIPFYGVSYYRLKQTDFDGSFTYSNLVAVKVMKDINFQTMPNPVVEQLTVYYGKIGGNQSNGQTEYDAKINIFNKECILLHF